MSEARPGRPSVQVKICGVTRREDAERAVELGAGYLGLNFYPASPRYLTPAAARRLAAGLRGRVQLVAVMVNPGAREIEAVLPLVDLIQFHGEESPEAIRPYARRAIKVVRPEGAAAAELERFAGVWGYLLEPRAGGPGGRPAGGPRGGSGRAWDYSAAPRLATDKPVFVAGGIHPGNVRRAAAGAWGIDVCSGVESKPGIKDPAALERLFSELRDGQG